MVESVELPRVLPALVTPLRGGELDLPALRRVVEHVITEGVDGVVALGGQGEGWAFGDDDRRAVVATTAEAAGDVPVVVGLWATTIDGAVAQARAAAQGGATAVLALPPHVPALSQAEIIDYFRRLADRAGLPVLLYNHPVRTQVILTPATVATLAEEPAIVGIKDSGGQFTRTLEYLEAVEGRLAVYVGNDAQIAAGVLHGAHGAIASCANVVPALISELVAAARRGDVARARDLQFQLLPLRRAFELGSFPVVVKEAVALLGLAEGEASPPVAPLPPDRRDQLASVLTGLGVLAEGHRPTAGATTGPDRTPTTGGVHA
ncbi:MAG: dihydrodipicolinate synthase [Modestobacter sp.]|nr:dihydrodipicolinate synthase [Modestobacter sp.]